MACFVLLAACNDNGDEANEDQLVKENDGETEVASTTLKLSPEEEKQYANLKKDLDSKHLQGLEPLSIAKIYVQAILDNAYDVEYALYTDREDAVQWSKEEHDAIPEADRGTLEENEKIFQNISNGEFIQVDENAGYIQYDTGHETKAFQLLKNDDGIWQVAFMPLQ